MKIVSGLLVAFAVAGLVAVGWVIGGFLAWTQVREPGSRWLDLYDVFDDEDADSIG